MRSTLLVSVLLSLALGACGPRAASSSVGSYATAPQASAGTAPSASSVGQPPPPNSEMPASSIGTDIALQLGQAASALVDGRADIYSSSQPRANPERGGVLPTRVTLPAGATSIEHVATGEVGCGTGEPSAGPAGGTCAGGVTNIEAADGISGIVDRTRTQFLVGVFLAGHAPSAPAPNLDVTPGQPGEAASRAPALGQTFYLGASATTAIPAGATELYLGFADGWSFQGAPSHYADNTGGFRVTLTAR
jgi:hypothetical protein